MNTKLLEKSSDLIKPQAEGFSKSFYNYLFEHNPELKPLFANIDQKAQEKKLIISLIAIVENLKNPDVLQKALKSLGARHFEVGTLEKHYPLVGKALLETFATYLGSAWTAELAYAWGEAYESIAKIMLEVAENPHAYLGPELTFYDWVDLYGEEDSQLKEAMATLTGFQYGSQSKKRTTTE